MRRAIATIGLTVTALTFILRFDHEKATMFAAATTFAETTTEPAVQPVEAPVTTADRPAGPPAMNDASSTGAPGTTTTTSTEAPAVQVIDGPVVPTRFGPVQVEVTVAGDTLTDVEALQLPNHALRSRQINGYVGPIYRKAALQSQSSDFWGVSGATVTWAGYVRSLQAALDQAGV